jgi:hypothetical protein|tara:strand:- start:104 stop:499 length:396 start_codon:yes stop_codon:yes gene_type:complete
MKPLNAITATAVACTCFAAASQAIAKDSTCNFEGTSPKTCQIRHRQIKQGWKDEVLVEPNGTTRIIARDMRGKGVQINLYAPGQSKGSFHEGTHRVVGKKFRVDTEDGGSYMTKGNQVIIYVDGGRFSYTL